MINEKEKIRLAKSEHSINHIDLLVASLRRSEGGKSQTQIALPDRANRN